VNTADSRTRITENHALIAPDSHVVSELPTWTNADIVVLISPQMGAGFTQYLVHTNSSSRMEPINDTTERLIFVIDGSIELNKDGQTITEEDYVYLPPDESFRLDSVEDGKLIVFEKEYQPRDGAGRPERVIGDLEDVEKEPFQGDPDARLQSLLPDDNAFDFGIYVFNFQPGATLPIVESHFMEHGLLLLDGQGIYKLNDDWYPVEEGDAIWMAPYLPQWFAAHGKEPSRYIYYKDANRHPVEGYS
jgi:(S)-ureidoglycine aminohydrolase